MKQNNDIHRYDDIIDLPHPVSKRHKPMSLYNRAAQFAPFAALTGHDAAVKETARLTDRKIELDEAEKSRLDEKMQLIVDNLDEEPIITVTYFVPDDKKDGGAYMDYTGILKRIDEYEHILIMMDKTIIPIEEVYKIESELFIKYGLID